MPARAKRCTRNLRFALLVFCFFRVHGGQGIALFIFFLPFPCLQATIKAHQQENSQKHDQCWSPLLYAKLLFLCSSPEEVLQRALHYLFFLCLPSTFVLTHSVVSLPLPGCTSPQAIHYLLIFSGEKSTSRFRAEAVHFALVLDAVRLLRNSSSEDFRAPILSGKVLNLNGVLRHYVRELSTVRAVPYIRYMRGRCVYPRVCRA